MFRYFLLFIVSFIFSFTLAAQTSASKVPFSEFENQYRQDSAESILQDRYRMAYNNRLNKEFFWLDSLLGAKVSSRKISQLRGDRKKITLQFEYTDILQEYTSKTSELNKRSVCFLLLLMQVDDNVLRVLQPNKTDSLETSAISLKYPNIKKAIEESRLEYSIYVVLGINVQQLPPTKLQPIDVSKRTAVPESEYQLRSSKALDSIQTYLQKNPKLSTKGFSVETYLEYEKNKKIVHPYDRWVYRENFLAFLEDKNKE